MGTRHLILVYYKRAWHIAQYGQWNGFPEGQGVTVLRFVANPANVSKLRAVLDDADNMLYTPSKQQLDEWYAQMTREWRAHYERGSGLTDAAEIEQWMAVDFPGRDVCPSVSRDTGAEILDVVANATAPVPVVKNMKFLAESGFCEWAYVVDLDEGAVEVYSHWAGVKVVKGGGETRFKKDENFKGMKDLPPLVGKWSFGDLPDEKEFIESLKRDEDGKTIPYLQE